MSEGNQLYYGDNLDVLQRHIPDESVDLVYLDPPFNSNADYNVLFAEEDGTRAAAQIEAFGDTWRWDQAAAQAFQEVVGSGGEVAKAMLAFKTLLGDSNMLAYLAMMAPRLQHLRRALKPTGSIYLHCDPTASHYLKLLMDSIFGPENFRNEITWKRANTVKGNFGQGAKFFGRNTDSVLFYGMSNKSYFEQQFMPYSNEYIEKTFRFEEPDTGRRYRLISMIGPGGAANGNPYYEVMGVKKYWRYSEERMQDLIEAGLVVQTKPGRVPSRKFYLDEGKGVPVQALWDDVPGLHAADKERLGYPTQKPVALLKRIIETSCPPDGVVLDPFCGCGTTIVAAEELGRRWVGIDVTYLAVALMKSRLAEVATSHYEVTGEPTSAEDAVQLAGDDPYQFQWWALGLIGARPVEEKKGADKGIDGRLYFFDDGSTSPKQLIVSVKAGKVTVSQLRDLVGVLNREDAQIGAFISLNEATGPMRKEAASAGVYTSPLTGTTHPKVQMLTVSELLEGRRLDLPAIAPQQSMTAAPAQAPAKPKPGQLSLGD